MCCCWLQLPFNQSSVLLDFLAAFQPSRHLRVLVSVISCTVHVLCEIDMKTFRLFCVIVVSSSEVHYRASVMSKAMKFRNIESFTDTEINKNSFIRVKSTQGLLKMVKCIPCMRGILCQIPEVK